VIHHTATPPNTTPQRLAEYQVNSQGRPGIGYHYVVGSNGSLFQTNRLAVASQHAGARDAAAVGVAFAGDFMQAAPPEEQLWAGGQLVGYLLDLFDLDEAQIVGVREFSDSASPGDQWMEGARWKDRLLEQVRQAIAPREDGTAERLEALQAQLEAQRAELERLRAENQALGAGPAPEAPPETPPIAEPTPAKDGKVGAPPMKVVIDALPRHKTKRYESRPLEAIQNLVVHHTAVPATVSLEKVAAYHVEKQDWPGIGYHFCIGADGTIYQCNHLTTNSYHAAGINTKSVGICFSGNFGKDPPPAAQIAGGAHLAAWLLQELDLPLESVRGHGEFMETQCPGRQWLSGKAWKDTLYAEIRRVQEEAQRASPVSERPLYHYLLFRQEPEAQAKAEFWGAEAYIAHFCPTVGFSVEEAMHAQYVTIVGGPSGVTHQEQARIEAAGSQVERIAGPDESETQHLLDKLVQQNRRFESLEG
jgi:N-acetyl-anhydromuramyl-L-alanine amidase AmpD